jgi:hypothetical protein
MSYGNNNNQGPKQEKLWASSAKKWLHFNNETDPATGRARKEQGAFDFEVTEEVSFSIKPQDVAELVGRIQDAAANQAGTGGVRISLYCRRQTSQQNREFDGIGILIYEQKPMQQGYGNRGGFQGQQRGRTNYPPRQQQAPVRAGYGGYRQGDQPQGEYQQPPAPQDTPPQNNYAPQAPARGQSAPGQAAPRNASPSRGNGPGQTQPAPTPRQAAPVASTPQGPVRNDSNVQPPQLPEDCPI